MWNPFKTKVVYAIPEVNSVWETRDPNPFDRYKVLVLAVREGYVKYNVGEKVTLYTPERSMAIKYFHEYYLEVSK